MDVVSPPFPVFRLRILPLRRRRSTRPLSTRKVYPSRAHSLVSVFMPHRADRRHRCLSGMRREGMTEQRTPSIKMSSTPPSVSCYFAFAYAILNSLKYLSSGKFFIIFHIFALFLRLRRRRIFGRIASAGSDRCGENVFVLSRGDSCAGMKICLQYLTERSFYLLVYISPSLSRLSVPSTFSQPLPAHAIHRSGH